MKDTDKVFLVLLGGLGGLALALYGAGVFLGRAQHAQPPRVDVSWLWLILRGDPEQAFGVTPSWLYWLVAIILIAGEVAAVIAAWRILGATAPRGTTTPTHAGRPVGTATRGQAVRVGGGRAVMRRARHLRPSLPRPTLADVALLLGRIDSSRLWMTVEDCALVIGPPRSGKGLHLAVNLILDAPGAVITTSTRPDNLDITLTPRQARGPVAVFDPQQLAPWAPGGLRWSPIRGCQDPQVAMVRAKGLAAGSGLGGSNVTEGAFWLGLTESVLRGLLHAAALDGRGADDLYRWSLDPAAAREAGRILDAHPASARGWGSALNAIIDSDPRSRDSVWHGVRQACSGLADPRVLESVTPRAGEEFDPAAFLGAHGTLYLLSTATGATGVANLIAALIEDLLEVARHLAADAPGQRLDPPVTLVLDEIGNLSPLPSLPALMSEGGGSGLVTIAVVQSLAQGRDKWGEATWGTVWGSAIVKIILGGNDDARDLRDLSDVIGQRDDETTSRSRNHDGTLSTSTSVRQVPIMPPSALRTLPFGTAVVLMRAAPPIVMHLRSWKSRRDAKALLAARRDTSGPGNPVESHTQLRPIP